MKSTNSYLTLLASVALVVVAALCASVEAGRKTKQKTTPNSIPFSYLMTIFNLFSRRRLRHPRPGVRP